MLVLASGSPRRGELLLGAGFRFEVRTAEVDEGALVVPGEPWITAEGTAMAKARAVAAHLPGDAVLGGDTVVAFEEEGGWTLLAKPVDDADAARMLGLLNGREHIVTTGVALVWGSAFSSGEMVSSETSRVRIDMSSAEIKAYVASGEPRGKAGAYAIQGGHRGITLVEGPMDNVIGFPMNLVRRMIASSGIEV